MIPTLAPARARSLQVSRAAWMVDVAALMITLLLFAALLVPGGGELPGRPAIALVVVTFVPGWAVLRVLGAPINPLSVLGAFALSVSSAILASLVTVTWLGWHWRALAVLWTSMTACALAIAITRPGRFRQSVDDVEDDYLYGDVTAPHLSWTVAQPSWRSASATDADTDASDSWLLWLVTLSGLLVAGSAIAAADAEAIDGYGLIAAVPPWYYAGVALLLVALFGQLRAGGRRGRIAATVNLGCLIVVLHGLPGFVEPEPRFSVAWLHAGFANQIASQGELLPLLDARFSWAGFFSGAAFVERLAGTPNLFWLLRFAPVTINALAALAVYSLAKAVNTTTTRSIVAATIFVFANWIGQDYFAPQAVGFVLVITVVAAVLMCFSDVPSRRPRLARVLGWQGTPRPAITGRPAVLVYLACLFVAAAIIASHQLSPPMLVAMLMALALVGRIRTKLLGAIVALGFVLWMAHAAESYWFGHLDDLFGQVGDVSGVLHSNVSQRAGPGSPARELVVRGRMVSILGVWALAGLAMLGQRRQRTLDPALAALFIAPFGVLALQSYGGEVLLRVALFTLPAASILIARMAAPLRAADRVGLPRIAVPVVALTLASPLFLLARFGNESYEQVIPNDRAVVSDMYRIVPDGARIYVVNRSTVMYSERLTGVKFRDVSSDPVTAEQILAAADTGDAAVYVLVTESQARYRQEVQGADPGWLTEFAARLLATGAFRIASQHGDSILLEHVRGDS